MAMKGSYHIHLFYPGYICLQPAVCYTFKVDGKDAAVAVTQYLDALKMIDFENQITKEGLANPVSPFSERTLRMAYDIGPPTLHREMVVDHLRKEHRLFFSTFYTELIIVHEVSDAATLSKAEQNFYMRILERFVSMYRLASHDVRIPMPQQVSRERMVVRDSTVTYTADDLKLTVSERLAKNRELKLKFKFVKFIDQTETFPSSEEDRTQWTARFCERCRTEQQDGIREEEFLVKALEEVSVTGNFRYALLEAFIAAESSVLCALQRVKIDKGISKTKLEEYDSEVSMSYKLNVEIPAFFGPLNEKEKAVLGRVNNVRRLRNAIMHKGSSVSQQEAGEAINSVAELMQMLRTKAAA